MKLKVFALFLARRPWLALVLATFLGWIMVDGTAEFRVAGSAPSWVTWVVIGFAGYGAVFALILVPRLIKVVDWRLMVIQWAGCVASFSIAWAGWFLFGLPVWVLGVGTVVSMASLLVLILSGVGRSTR